MRATRACGRRFSRGLRLASKRSPDRSPTLAPFALARYRKRNPTAGEALAASSVSVRYPGERAASSARKPASAPGYKLLDRNERICVMRSKIVR